MQILLSCIPAWGHFRRTYATAIELRDAGHDVAVACSGQFAAELAAADLKHFPAGLAEFPAPPPNLGPMGNNRWLLKNSMPKITQAMFEDLDELLADLSPDLLLREFAERGSLLAARKHEVPHVSVAAEATAGLIATVDIGGWVRRLAARLDLDGNFDPDQHSPLLHMFPAPGGFLPEDAPVLPALRHVRHQLHTTEADIAAQVVAELDSSLPLVLVSVGTIVGHIFADAIGGLLTELADVRASIVFLSGGHQTAGIERISRHRIALLNGPQQALLPHAQALVCHGGFQSVIEALTAGVPVVNVPYNYNGEHEYAAARCAALGVGVTADLEVAGSCRRAVELVLADDRFAVAARSYATANEGLPTVAEALAEAV